MFDIRRGLLSRLTSNPATELQTTWSPDGTRLAFTANIRVSVNGGTQRRWRPDGTELFYVGLDDRLWTVPIRKLTSGALEPSTPIALFPTHIGGAVQDLTSASYMVTRDGRFLMNTLLEESGASRSDSS